MQRFRDALRHGLWGIGYAFKTQRNFRIQIIIFLLVVLTGILLEISPMEWLAILIISSIILSLEVMNTAIEKAVDTYTNGEYSLHAKIAKDAAAGAVVISAIFSVIIGIIIFLPKILRYWK